MAALLSQQEALPVVGQDLPGGLRLFRDQPTLPPHARQGNPTAAPTSSPSLTDYSPTVLTSRGAPQLDMSGPYRKVFNTTLIKRLPTQ